MTAADRCPRCGAPMTASPVLGWPNICSDYFCASGLRPHNKSPSEDLADLLKTPIGQEAAESLLREIAQPKGQPASPKQGTRQRAPKKTADP